MSRISLTSAPALKTRSPPVITTHRAPRTSGSSSAASELALDRGGERVELLLAAERQHRRRALAPQFDQRTAHRTPSSTAGGGSPTPQASAPPSTTIVVPVTYAPPGVAQERDQRPDLLRPPEPPERDAALPLGDVVGS